MRGVLDTGRRGLDRTRQLKHQVTHTNSEESNMTMTLSGNDDQTAAQSAPNDVCAKVIGLVRIDVSGLDSPRHAVEVRRHAEARGYRHLYTVRPPEREPDPIGYALGIASGVNATAVVIYDLDTVDHSPVRICEYLDLETVCPPMTWARVGRQSFAPTFPLDTGDEPMIPTWIDVGKDVYFVIDNAEHEPLAEDISAVVSVNDKGEFVLGGCRFGPEHLCVDHYCKVVYSNPIEETASYTVEVWPIPNDDA
jgi:hypothetical protein